MYRRKKKVKGLLSGILAATVVAGTMGSTGGGDNFCRRAG